jgi:hypothetical protein
MRKISALAMIALLGGFGAALANDQTPADAPAAQERPMSADAVKEKADAMGYDVEHLKTDGDRYKARLRDRESGAGVKAAFDKETGELTGAKLARGEHERGERKEARERKESREHRDEHRESREHERRGDRHD